MELSQLNLTPLQYAIYLNVPANTPANSPVSTSGNANYPSLTLPQGIISKIIPIFPSGVNETVYCQLLINGNVVFPNASNQGNYFTTSDTQQLVISVGIPLSGGDNILDIRAYNLDTTNSHLIGFMVEVDA